MNGYGPLGDQSRGSGEPCSGGGLVGRGRGREGGCMIRKDGEKSAGEFSKRGRLGLDPKNDRKGSLEEFLKSPTT